MNRRLFTALALAAFLFVFAAAPTHTYAAAPPDLDWKLTYAEGNHLLKAHLNASANEITSGKTTIHIHGQQPIVIEQGNPNVKATLDGLEEGKSYQGTITFEGVVAGQKVSVYECFTLYAATPGKSLNEKHILKYGECEDRASIPQQPSDGSQQPGGEEPKQPGEKPESPEGSVDNPKGGKMPNTATGNPTGLLFGSLFLAAGAVLLLKRRALN